MHILRALVGFLGLDGWFPNFADIANTNAQNPKVSLTDSLTTYNPGPDSSRNWGSAVLFPEENKIFITPNSSAVDTNHGNRGLIYDITTDTYTQSSVVFPDAPQFGFLQWSSILLENGKALITQGADGQPGTKSYYLYDIKTDTIASIGTTSNHWYQMIKLKDDQVYMLGVTLSLGGFNVGAAQIFNSKTNTFTSINPPPWVEGYEFSTRVRFLTQLVLLPNGKLLIIPPNPADSSYIYDQDTNTYTASNCPSGTGICLLPDGFRIFSVRGLYQVPGPAQDSNGYIWNSNTGTTQTVPNVSVGYFFDASSVLIPDGRIAVAYGPTSSGSSSIRMVDPVTLTVTTAAGGQLGASNLNNTIMMPNGKVLMVQRRRLATGNKFPVLSGEFSNGVQYPLRQYQGSYLNGGDTNY